jgi:hypothetical protein
MSSRNANTVAIALLIHTSIGPRRSSMAAAALTASTRRRRPRDRRRRRLRFGDASAFEAAIEHATGRTNERMTLDVLAITRRLADEHELGVAGAFADDRLCRVLPQVAGATLADRLSQRRERGARGDRGGWAFDFGHGCHPIQPLPLR